MSGYIVKCNWCKEEMDMRKGEIRWVKGLFGERLSFHPRCRTLYFDSKHNPEEVELK